MPVDMRQIEEFVEQFMAAEPGHDFEHIKRVRNWALKIARAEGCEDLEVVEAAALLHDIGIPAANPRRKHGEAGAEMAREFLAERGFFTENQIEEICHAIQYHCTNRGGDGKLLDVLRDADMMDMFGAMASRHLQHAIDLDSLSLV